MKTSKIIVLFLGIFLFFSCKKSSNFDSDATKFKDYLTSYSSGLVSSNADIQVGLNFGKSDWLPNQELDRDLFEISPNVKGKVIAINPNLVAFKPEKPLEQDTEYQVTLHLDKIVEVDDDLAEFNFTVKTIKQDFVVQPTELQSYSKEYQYIKGVIKTADNLDFASVEKLLEAEHNGKDLKIKFDKKIATQTEFYFIIDSIKRGEDDSKVEISWDGDDFDIDQEGETTFEIPAKNSFKVINITPVKEGNQALYINFSDPVKKEQIFDGLVAVESTSDVTYATEGNLLKVFFENPIDGNLLVEVFQGIESIYEQKLTQTFSKKINFTQEKPKVEFVKSGSILPSSNNLQVQFKAVNLKAVDVKVYRIFENNVLQFLQDNPLNGNYELRKVAKPIAKKTVQLKVNNLTDYSKWNTYAIDMTNLVKPEPGAIYRLEITFKKEYSLYPCADSGETVSQISDTEEEPTDEDENYDSEEYYDYYGYDYDWEQRDNPCHNSYYYDKNISTNILATDLGVIVKRGENNTYFVAVSNIVTTEPVDNATIEVFTFQKQKLGEFETDSDGFANFTLDKKAFFAVVKKDNNTTYVKLDDGYSLSVSNFEVDGTSLQKGLKGFIYGERGVWRPGDSLYISFILNDLAVKLPASHPIKLRVSDPNGKVTFQSVQRYTKANHYKFVVPTSPNAPTGNWEARISVGGAKFYKNLKIETIKPNRLKIKNNLENKFLSAKVPTTATFQVNWLHGAVAKDLKMDIQAKFTQQVTTFKGYQNYVFDNPTRKFSSEETNIFSGKTTANGTVQVPIKPNLTSQAPGMLKVAFMTKVYENGGDFSTDVAATTYSPYPTYIGLKTPQANDYGMLEVDTNNTFEVVSVDESGKVKANQTLEVSVYKVEWRWWWDDSSDDLSDFTTSESRNAVFTKKITTNTAGKGSFSFKIDEEEWGRYLVIVSDENGGHSTGQTVYIDYPSWSGRSRNMTGDEATMLMFSTDKKQYNVGEETTISFPSSEGGRALVTLENGSEVVHQQWVKSKKGETKFSIKITEKMSPNVYIHISLLQPHASTKNDSPIRMYGIVPIEIINKSTVLEPQIMMPEVLRPEQNTTIKVSEKNGKAMTYTLAIVDEGLLDLTRFKTPNAWQNFYGKEALGVKTWDIYNDVIGAYGAKVNQVFSIGGDEDLGGGKTKKANRFKPVVMYFGPFTLKSGQTQTHTIKLPKYIGSVKAMVVAAQAETASYGSTEKVAAVRSPLMVLASLPRKVSPSEKITLPITVFAMEKHVKNVNIQVKTEGSLQVVGAKAQNLSFANPDEKMAYFEMQAGNTMGITKVYVTATSGKEKASYVVELDVMNPNPVSFQTKELVLNANETATLDWTPFGISGSNKAKVEFSTFPSFDLNKRLNYLIQYPHGCVEQTTSAAFPQLYIADLATLDAQQKQKIQKNITKAIQKLSQFQLASGGFGYWQGALQADDWATTYVGHFLIEAEKKGYALPINFKKSWINFQKREAKNWRPQHLGSDFAQAYRLYTLAMAGNPDISSMNRLKETENLTNDAKLRLALTYAMVGQKQVALKLLQESTIDETNNRYYYYYGSEDRNRAMTLETLIYLGQYQKAFVEAQKLATVMSSNQWMSTQTTAYCLYSMTKFANISSKELNVNYASAGKQQTVKVSKSYAEQNLSSQKGENNVTLRNNSDKMVYVKLSYSGILPIGEEQEYQRGLATKVYFKDRKGYDININSLAQGTEFEAIVTVANTSGERVENIALTQFIPSGWEIVNSRFTEFGETTGTSAVDYTDIRDDRTQYYFSLNARETKTFRMVLNASYLGTYYLPGTQAEAMYDNNFATRTQGRWVKVVK